MDKFVITYDTGCWDCSCEIIECFESESQEKLEFDFELAYEAACKRAVRPGLNVQFEFCGIRFDTDYFLGRDKSYCPPKFESIDNWFDRKRRGE